MRQNGDAVAPAAPDLAVAERPVVGREDILDGTVRAPNEDGAHTMRSRGHLERLGGKAHSVGVGDVHPAIHLEQGQRLAVQGDLDLLAGGHAAGDLAGGGVLEPELEGVVAVRREVVDHADAASGAAGRAGHPVPLRRVARIGVGHRVAGRVGYPDRQPADLVRGAKVGVQVGGGEHLNVGDVVEVRALGVERQIVATVDFKVEQVADGRRVFRPVQALEGPVSGHRVAGSGFVDELFQGLDQHDQGIACRSRHAGRRHHARAQLANHLLGGLRGLRSILHMERRETEIAGQQGVVVADLAVHANDAGQVLRRDVAGDIRGRGESDRLEAVAGSGPGRLADCRGEAGERHQAGEGESHGICLQGMRRGNPNRVPGLPEQPAPCRSQADRRKLETANQPTQYCPMTRFRNTRADT